MSNRKRTLAGFDTVASIDNDNNINNNINNDNDNNIIKEAVKTKETKKFTGIYFDPDVLKVLDKLTEGKKGAKSEIVNNAVKALFQKEGYM